jgi:hypothetical protein
VIDMVLLRTYDAVKSKYLVAEQTNRPVNRSESCIHINYHARHIDRLLVPKPAAIANHCCCCVEW